MTEEIELYNVPRNSIIEFEGQKIFFFHVDGLYSYCRLVLEDPNSVIHLKMFCKVKVLGSFDPIRRN